MDTILEGLNEAQKSAVTSQASVLQVLAPPGSGKTKTLTARVAYLVSREGLKPWNIIVCTFTLKAAREMKERIRGMVGEKIESKLILGTFHSVARRFLVRYGQEIGIEKNFGIADTTDSKAMIKRIITRNQYGIDPGNARSRISGLKAKGISAEQFVATNKSVDHQEFASIYSEYEETLKFSNLLDYDDLLLRCTDLLSQHRACVSSIEAVLIDEYQDTNNVQYELMSLMAQKLKRITIVGDPDQSIYSFRSAEIKNLFRMQDDYSGTVVINLENNYRSSGCILNSSMAVIEQDETRPTKPLVATHGAGQQPTLRHLATKDIEAQWIVEEIKRSKSLTAGLLAFHDYAILLRSSTLQMPLEKALGKAGIPYRMVGGHRFFDRAEIKILLDYLRVINQPDHNDALIRVINVPARKIGELTVKGLLNEAEKRKVTLWSLILGFAQGRTKPRTKISAQAQNGIDIFVNIILSSQKKLIPRDGESSCLLDVIAHVLEKVSLQAYLKTMHKENWQERWDNVNELVVQASQIASAAGVDDADALPVVDGVEQRQDTAADVLSKFLANVALSTEVEKTEGEELSQVTISTIHAAKGLEWPIVFIPGVYDGSIPHSRAEDHDEERRLLYVGMTHLAQILRRPSPSPETLNAARFSEIHTEDDRYPASREEIDGLEDSWGITNRVEDGPRWNKFAPGGDASRPFKRAKFDASGSKMISTTMLSTTLSTASTTMPPNKPGFETASVHLKIMQEAQALGAQLSAQNDLYRKPTPRSKPSHSSISSTSTSKPPKPRAPNQSSIAAFFNKPSLSHSDSDSSHHPIPEKNLNPPGFHRAHSLSSAPLGNISNTLPNITNSSRKPLQSRMSSKPKRKTPEPAEQRYVLLSSSPAKPDRNPLPLEVPEDDLPDEDMMDSTNRMSTTSVGLGGFKPASTFHTTSTGHMQHGAGSGPPLGQKKTLGMRRSMQGWSVKHSAPPRPRQ
ncbi:P-loop containing nucleoside triphosphate hydrolase protein [Dendryphion nanum]|uniref:DNA 3'-5' helicase n=1 Tax=Dendryphion nanum TaxID=256645 RepID=A0A9P9DIW7_9PLEO|nr:P-loop containing nucleoside triphosphate hydrolase protein [Dendryphion nanum]